MKRTLILLLLLAFPASLFAADVTGRFAPHEKYVAPADHAPATTSRMFVRTVTREATSLDIPAAGESGLLVWTIPVRKAASRLQTNAADRMPMSAALTTPTGDVLRPGDNGDAARGLRRFRFDSSEVGIELPRGMQEVLHVERSEAASYRLELQMPEDVAGVTVVAAEPDSRIVLSTYAAPLSRQPGEPVTLRAELRDGEAAITGARVTARLATPDGKAGAPLELVDEGNGVYRVVLTDLPSATAGAWQVRFEADGRTANGTRFARTGSGELVNERGAARFGEISATIVDGSLRVTAPTEIKRAGMYRFDVIVAGAADANGARPALAWGEGVRNLAAGSTTLTLDLPAGVTSTDGLQFDVRLLGLDEVGVAARVVK
ncbi:MAG TPA: hypothetical protein VGF69_25415 [Thermoanaerobaculia bacterium]|jgi:hypothetical protein